MKKIIIIGGGIAGLSAGIYARKAGFEAVIYEKNAIAGGQCIGWNRQGHHIDNCIHWLTGTKEGTSLHNIWKEVGALTADTEYVQGDKFYESRLGSETVILWKDLDRTEKELLAFSPEDTEEIQKFMKHVRYAMDCEMPADKPMDMMGLKDYIEMGKQMANMPKVMKEYGKINLNDMAARFKHPLLKLLFTDYLPKDYQASSFIVSYASIVSGNGEIPKGGSLEMTNRIVERYKSLGGVLHLNSPVEKIIVSGKKAVGIKLESGSEIKAEYVISAVDTAEMFYKLLGEKYMNKKWRQCYEKQDEHPTFSGFQMAFSVEKNAYSNTGTVFMECEPFYIGKQKIDRISVKGYEYETDWAPKDRIVIQTNIPMFDEEFAYLKSLTKDDYKLLKETVSNEIMIRLKNQFSEVGESLKLLDCWTPLTYERYCNSYRGAYMSFITKKDVKPYRPKGAIEGIPNVFVASQWLMAPGGLPVAVATGKFAIQRIIKKNKI